MCLISTSTEPVICDGGCGLAACPKTAEQDWSGYGQEDSHDFTPADWDCGLGEVDCGGR
jgi:hypothetical protein